MRSLKLCMIITLFTSTYWFLVTLVNFIVTATSERFELVVSDPVLRLEFEKLIKAMFSSLDCELSRHHLGSIPCNSTLFVCMMAGCFFYHVKEFRLNIPLAQYQLSFYISTADHPEQYSNASAE